VGEGVELDLGRDLGHAGGTRWIVFVHVVVVLCFSCCVFMFCLCFFVFLCVVYFLLWVLCGFLWLFVWFYCVVVFFLLSVVCVVLLCVPVAEGMGVGRCCADGMGPCCVFVFLLWVFGVFFVVVVGLLCVPCVPVSSALLGWHCCGCFFCFRVFLLLRRCFIFIVFVCSILYIYIYGFSCVCCGCLCLPRFCFLFMDVLCFCFVDLWGQFTFGVNLRLFLDVLLVFCVLLNCSICCGWCFFSSVCVCTFLVDFVLFRVLTVFLCVFVFPCFC